MSSLYKHKFLLYLLQKRASKTYKFDMWLQPIKNRIINLQKLKANSHTPPTWHFVYHYYTSCNFLIISAFFAACLLGRISPAGSSCSSSSVVLFIFATSNGTKCWMGLLIVHVLLVFSWYANNSTPRILLSRRSFPFPHNNLDLFRSLIRTTSPILKILRKDHKSNGLVSNFLESDRRLSKSKDGN